MSSDHPIKKCEFCQGESKSIGTIWVDKIEDEDFIKKCLHELQKIEWLNARFELDKLLNSLKEETIPFYYDIHKVCKRQKLIIPRFSALSKKLKEMGFEAKRTHFSREGIKTDVGIKELIEAISSC